MFSSYEVSRALVTERQSTLQQEARQHRLGRLARSARLAHRAGRSVPAPTPDVRPVRAAPATPELSPPAALEAWRRDQRAA